MKRSKTRLQKDNFYLSIYELLKKGLNPQKISKELDISKQKLNYYIRRLKKEGIIEKKGYGTWEVKTLTLNTLQLSRPKSVRGHAFIWSVKLPKENYDWETKLKKNNISFELVRGIIPRIIVQGNKIWLGKKTLTIYSPYSFYGNNAMNSRKYATIGLIEVLRELQSKLSFKLGKIIYKPTREHYGLVKNELAHQVNREGEKIAIYDDLEGNWLWIDDSYSLGELETGGIKAMQRNVQVQNWWNDNKKHNFELTTSKTLEMIQGLAKDNIQLREEINQLKLNVPKETKELIDYFDYIR